MSQILIGQGTASNVDEPKNCSVIPLIAKKTCISGLLLLASLFSPSLSYANNVDNNLDAQFTALYEQEFGENNKNKPKPVFVSNPAGQNIKSLSSQKKTVKILPKKSESKKQTQHDMADLFAQAFGKKPKKAAPSKIKVELRVNKSVISDITLFSSKNNDIDSADSDQILELLKDVIKEHIFKRIHKKISAKDRVTFKTLTSLGMKATYNSVNLSLDLQINPEMRKPRVLSMRSKKKAGVRDENKITAEEISGFLNLYSNLRLNSTSKTKTDLSVKLETSVNIKGVVFENEIDLRDEQFEVGRTSLTYDRPDKLQRLVIGDFSTSSRNFQQNLELTGVKLSKEFFMDPELQITPQGNQSFKLDSESEVEVYINNRLHRRFYLEEGIYSLEDIGLYDGINDIRLRIKDEFGKITIKTSQHFYDSHLLKPGLTLYSFGVGILNKDNEPESANNNIDNKAIFSGYFQKGISKNLTLSLDAQLNQDSYLFGAEALTSFSLGSFKNSVAFSGGKDKENGFATLVEFKPNINRQLIGLDTLREDMLELDNSIGSFVRGWTITGEFRSEQFTTLDQYQQKLQKSDQLKARLDTRFGFNISKEWFGSANIGVAKYHDDESGLLANLSASKRFNNGVRLSLGARYDKQDDFSVNLQLSIPLDRDTSSRRKGLDILADSKNNSYEARLSMKPKSKAGKGALDGSVEYYQDDSTRRQKLDLRYRGNNFESQFVARNSSGVGSSTSNNNSGINIGFNTSLACVGKHCATSLPINDSFALVSGPSNQDRPIAIITGNSRFKYSDSNSGANLPDNYTALIPAKGKNGLVGLDSYRYQNVNIDESTLPNGYDSDKTEFEVFPRYHQGFIIKAGGEPSTILDGILVDTAQKPLGFKGGQWVALDQGENSIAFFSNKAGRFRITSIPAGKYKLELFDYPDMQEVTINVPDLKGQVHELGSLVVNE